MRETGGRHELKHYISRADVLQLQARLPYVAQPDEHALSGSGYRVRSLYFDNYSDKALREKIDGVDEREKFRIRFYNDDPSFVRLEKKRKKGGIGFKQSVALSAQLCRELLDGKYGALMETGDPLHAEFYAKLHYEQLRPQNIVDYWRDAFVFKAGNVRITLDYGIRAGNNPAEFLNQQFISILIPEVCILEVKYDNFLPELIRGIVTLSGRTQTAFSKYAAARII